MASNFKPLKYIDSPGKVIKKESFTTSNGTKVSITTIKLEKKIPPSK